MKIKPEEVKYIARLAKLNLTEDEIRQYTREFDDILEHFAVIAGYDVDDVEINILDEVLAAPLRKDEPKLFGDQQKLYQNTKSLKDGLIQVPKIIE